MVTELRVFRNCRKHPPVNRASQVTLRYLEPAGMRTVSGSCNSQVVTRAVYSRGAARVAAGGGIFQNLPKAQVNENWRKFHEEKLNLYFKFIRYYACLLLVFCSIYFHYPNPRF
jgi:hypothetical protein